MIKIQVANESHLKYAYEICNLMEEAALIRGTGIAKRSPEYIKTKMQEGKAVIALEEDVFAGFCYIETWSHEKFVANSGLIVKESYRGHGLAKQIKFKIFELSRQKYPDAKIFGITTGLAVMKINSDLGYKPVTFSVLTDDEAFWKGCQSCVNYDILSRTNRKHCLCTGMLYDPKEQENEKTEEKTFKKSWNVYERWLHFKQTVLLKLKEKKEKRQERRKQAKTLNTHKKSLMRLFF